jgi:hypothetical protein
LLLTGLLLLGVAALASLGVWWWLRSSEAPAIEAPAVASVAIPSPPPATPAVELPPQRLDPPREEPEVQAPAPPIAPKTTRLTIDEYGVGTAVAHRTLVGKSDRLRAGTNAFFWTLVLGGRSGDRVHHVWLKDGQVVRVLELPVDGSRWRTYSRQSLAIDDVGSWAVEARDLSGAVLARAEFDCQAP